MAQRRHHYERAFEWFLRSRRIPYVAVDEARKALLPDSAVLKVGGESSGHAAANSAALKSFDFVIYGDTGGGGTNLLIDIKGRRVGSSRSVKRDSALLAGRLESWVTMDDVDSLRTWEGLFGPGFQAAFIFVYWCDRQPPDALFQEIFEYRGVWYALRAATLRAYAEHMKIRSPRWRTVDVPRAAFERITQPFAPSPSGHSAAANGLFDPGPEIPALLPMRSAHATVGWGGGPTL